MEEQGTRRAARICRWNCVVAFNMLVAAARPVFADVYTYVGKDQVIVLTNLKPQEQHVEVIVAEPQSWSQGAPPRPIRLNGRGAEFNELISVAAKAFSIESALLHAVISVESDYVATARSRRGASGLMQLMPETARAFGVKDLFDPAQNINAGARYLRYLLDKYDQNLDIVLSAYNAGETALARHGGKPPPFPETLRYVELVRERYSRFRDQSDYHLGRD
jgi:soluble lytic murein transglycosylase-like protein